MLHDIIKSLPVAHDDGRFISEKVSRVVDLVRTYDSRLDVKWIPPEVRAPGDAAFAVIERLADGQEVIAFHVQDESEMDERVLERLFLGDNAKHDVQARMEAKNMAARALKAAEHMDQQAFNSDVAAHVLASPKSTYTVKENDGRVKVYDERGSHYISRPKLIR